ncbi:chondrolectin [Brienomyrus brachyistius]|uniref:chondrolectin n=1 Tax=Brienomyrus brachyistius TaxID=42636 RepID=UPI0020B349E2|nr:chondrolectin [Brienomyrus brachyistius]
MRRDRSILLAVCGLIITAVGCQGVRVLSGQTVCLAGPAEPCYKLAYFRDMTSRVAFIEAQRACEMDGGTLLSVESGAEQRLIEHLLQELSNTSSGSALGPGAVDGDFWIGLTRTEGEPQDHGSFASCPDLYRWTDGSTATFRNWYYDEPSCGGEACVVMYHQPNALSGLGGPYLYQWNDDRCNMKHNFICKYKPDNEQDKKFSAKPGPSEPDLSNKEPDVKEETLVPPHVIATGPSGLLLVYVIIPTIPLLLLILVASGTCCFQMLSKSKPRAKTSVKQPTLWISKTPKTDSGMEV